ncbi:Uu.00g078060.m01.CDS01 [Anthostomella pinea]|uniref:Uu.00g078060.m01.CDS01 n=1 Tax=Anthostomella pinea TaxID=933095 RepID=A0AAI8VKI5_9PEZI|nr:Uu.00g078060.m01.CDS01 [Anthostomella pinea]
MAPIQGIFSIIPDAPSAINTNHDAANSRPSRRPMTSKQAKKAYQKANKAPKLSKAEQRRQDLFEQDRIRKEFEKEKSQARARAARDKKKDKEDRERAEKKKKGLPLVEVHPSQDTIARFVRPRPRTESPAIIARKEYGSDSCTEDDHEPPAKKPRLDPPIQENCRSTRISSEPVPQLPVPEPEPEPASNEATDDAPVRPVQLADTKPSRGSHADEDPLLIDDVDDQLLSDLLGVMDSAREIAAAEPQRGTRLRGHESPAKPPPPKHPEDSMQSQKAGESYAPTCESGAKEDHTPRQARELLQDLSAKKTNARIFSTLQDTSLTPMKQVVTRNPIISTAASVVRPLEGPSKTDVKARTFTTPQSKPPVQEKQPVTRQPTINTPAPVARSMEGLSTKEANATIATTPKSEPEVQAWQPVTRQPIINTPAPVTRPLKDLSKKEVNARAVTTPQNKPPVQERQPIARQPIINTPTAIAPKPQTLGSASRSFRHPKTPMGPPPVPPKFKSPHVVSGGTPRSPQFMPKQPRLSDRQAAAKPYNPTMPQQAPTECPPTSTQLFMLGQFDDFFPSPSQEVRELFEEPKDSPVRHGNPIRSRNAHPAPLPLQRHLPPPAIPSASRLGRFATPGRQKTRCKGSPGLLDNPCANSRLPAIAATVDIPFFSTQDLFLSSQDVKDIEEEPISPVKAQPPAQRALPTSSPSARHVSSHASAVRVDRTGMAVTNPKPDPKLQRGKFGHMNRDVNTASCRTQTPPTRPPDDPTPIPNAMALEGSELVKHQAQKELDGLTGDGCGSAEFVQISSNMGKDLGNLTLHAVKACPEPYKSVAADPERRSSAAQSAVTPRLSPKPFFTPSGRTMQYKYVLERSKTTAWEDPEARQKAQEELDHLRVREDERLKELLEADEEEEGGKAQGADETNGSSLSVKDPVSQARSKPATQREAESRTTSQQRSSMSKHTTSQKTKPSNMENKARRVPSSYERMLGLASLDQNKGQKPGRDQEEQAMPASQETDYEEGWDDALCDIL